MCLLEKETETPSPSGSEQWNPALPADARGRGWAKFKLYPEDHVKLTRIINREVTTPNSFRKITLARILDDWRGGGLTKW